MIYRKTKSWVATPQKTFWNMHYEAACWPCVTSLGNRRPLLLYYHAPSGGPTTASWDYLSSSGCRRLHPQKREGARPSMIYRKTKSWVATPQKAIWNIIMRQPAALAWQRWTTSNLYFYSNMRPAVGPLLHLEIISAAMGVAGCIPRNERGLDLPKVYFSRSKNDSSFSKRWNRDPWHDIEIYLMKQVSVRSSWQSIVSSCTNRKTCVHHQGCQK